MSEVEDDQSPERDLLALTDCTASDRYVWLRPWWMAWMMRRE